VSTRIAGIVLFTLLISLSCSTDSGPQQGTPAFYWSAAKETFAAADYGKTVEHLEKILATENEYTARARPWLLIITSGMARGNMYLADGFEAGARASKTNQTAFRRSTNTYRGEAKRFSLEFVEVYDKFQKGKDEPVPLAFPFPTGSAAPVMQVTKASAGMMPQPEEMESAEKRAIGRGVLLATCDAVGAPEDTAKARELLKPGTLQIPHAAFMTAMASSLFDQSQLYGPRKIDDPDKVKIFCSRALDALKSVPETKQTKELSTKISKSMKKS
jgi:hypothetical protein